MCVSIPCGMSIVVTIYTFSHIYVKTNINKRRGLNFTFILCSLSIFSYNYQRITYFYVKYTVIIVFPSSTLVSKTYDNFYVIMIIKWNSTIELGVRWYFCHLFLYIIFFYFIKFTVLYFVDDLCFISSLPLYLSLYSLQLSFIVLLSTLRFE